LGHGAINASPMLMFPFLTGDPDRLIGPIPVGIVGGLGYILLALLIFFSARALVQSTPAPMDKAPSEKTWSGEEDRHA